MPQLSTKENVKNSSKNDFKVIFSDDNNNDANALFSVIVSKHGDKWVFCRHKDRATYELPGGHIEQGETPYDAAKRELFEETGAIDFALHRVCTYGVERDGKVSYGVLFFAQIYSFSKLPEMEMAEIIFRDKMPGELTYPHIQPFLYQNVSKWLENNQTLVRRKYKAILFDLDGTIFDNFGALDKAIEMMYENTLEFHKMPFDRFKILYENIQDKYFRMFQGKKLTWKEQRICRMRGLYSHFGISLADDEAYDKFLMFLSIFEEHWKLLDNAHELLDKLKKSGCKIGMVTNGEINQQIQKLKSQNIYDFFDCVIASSEYDFAKPDKRIFEIALGELNAKSHEALFVGDSVRSDICGACNADIDSVYTLREHNKDYVLDCKPTYIIKNLDEMYDIVRVD